MKYIILEIFFVLRYLKPNKMINVSFLIGQYLRQFDKKSKKPLNMKEHAYKIFSTASITWYTVYFGGNDEQDLN